MIIIFKKRTPLIANWDQIMEFEKIQNSMPALKVMKA